MRNLVAGTSINRYNIYIYIYIYIYKCIYTRNTGPQAGSTNYMKKHSLVWLQSAAGRLLRMARGSLGNTSAPSPKAPRACFGVALSLYLTVYVISFISVSSLFQIYLCFAYFLFSFVYSPSKAVPRNSFRFSSFIGFHQVYFPKFRPFVCCFL